MQLSQEQRQELISKAREVRKHAYAPYSDYAVGSALLAESGAYYTGVNVENAAYPEGICAERASVFKAVASGERKFLAIAVVSENGGSPCGACRQVLSEFARDMVVILANAKGEVVLETDLQALLPYSFGPEDLD